MDLARKSVLGETLPPTMQGTQGRVEKLTDTRKPREGRRSCVFAAYFLAEAEYREVTNGGVVVLGSRRPLGEPLLFEGSEARLPSSADLEAISIWKLVC